MSVARLNSISSACSVAFDAKDIPISVDIVETARFLLDFLSEISSKPELYEGPLVECAVQRYERYWLPLVAKHPGRLLPAPLDIEWVWHCHMLSPEAYNTDCCNIVGKVIDHHLIDSAQRKELMKDSERLWRNEYADVPFSACDAVTPWFDCEFVSALTYDLISAIARQKIFYYQVSLPHYRDEKFLNNALQRYMKFLFLKCHNPGQFLVPCYDNDLMWHTHMLHPIIYKDDTEAYLGSLLPHDDSVNDRSPGSKLCLAEAKTRNLWRKVFNEKYSHFGAMYRGEPPNSKLNAMNKEDIYKVCTKQANVLIEKIRISGLPPGKTYKLKLCYNTGYQNFNRSLFVTENIATVKGNSRTLEDNKINTHFSFDTRYNDKVIASLQQKSGKLCLGTSDTVGEGKIDLQKKIQPLNSKGLTANDDIDCGDGLSIGLVWSCPAPDLGPCVLRLEPGDYQSCVMPEDRETMWGPIPLPRLPHGVENYCSVASHKLFNHTRRVVFTVRMIHSEPLLMSAIHVFYGDKLTTVAHLVVGDQLPLPISVADTKKCVTLNPKEGQRAVLIKNNSGDWGVAVGWWEGYQRKLTGRKGSGSEGHLEVRFFHLLTNRWHYVSFDRLYSLATSKFEIGDCVVEFDSGFIEINSQRGEIAENLSLIFSVALIHVLCQPRPSNWAPKLESSKAEEQALPRLGGSEEIALLLAAGVLIATPSNHAIKNLFKKKKQQFGEGGSMRRRTQQEEEAYEQNGGPAVILHEAEVSAGWSEDWNNAGSSNIDATDAAVIVGSALTSIKEGEGNETEEEEEEEEEQNNEADDEDKNGDTVALLAVSTILNGSPNSSKDESDESEDNGGGGDDDDDENDRSGVGVAGVFALDDFNVDADSQTGLFGNGEDDSDEVEEDDTGFGLVSSGDDEDDANDGVFNLDHSSDNHDDNDGMGNVLGLDMNGDIGDENETDNYFDDFYNIGDDDPVNGFGNNDDHGGGIFGGDDTKSHANENHTMFGGVESDKHSNSGMFGGGGDINGRHDGHDSGDHSGLALIESGSGHDEGDGGN